MEKLRIYRSKMSLRVLMRPMRSVSQMARVQNSEDVTCSLEPAVKT